MAQPGYYLAIAGYYQRAGERFASYGVTQRPQGQKGRRVMQPEPVEFLSQTGESWSEVTAGLVEECLRCKAVRAALNELEMLAGNVEIVGEIRVWERQEWRSTKGNIAHGMRVDCPICHNTGNALTKKGRRLMVFIQKWLPDFPQAKGVDAEEDEL